MRRWPARIGAGVLAGAAVAAPAAAPGAVSPRADTSPGHEGARAASHLRSAPSATGRVPSGRERKRSHGRFAYSDGFSWPLDGPVTSGYGPRWGRLHAGLDISARTGTPVRATAAGVVVLAEPHGAYGKYVCVRSTLSTTIARARTWTACYAHLSRIVARAGKVVRRGEAIGYSGCTGSCFGEHLHFEIRRGRTPTSPAEDPRWLIAESDRRAVRLTTREALRRRAIRRRARAGIRTARRLTGVPVPALVPDPARRTT